MSDENDTIPAEALADVAYLSRSANRVEILQTLTRGSHTRRDLTKLTGASRTTLDRIVNELEERGWARRTDDGDYTATPAGDHLMAQLLPFVESVEAIRRLDETVAWLPSEDLSIGLHHFSDASVLRPDHGDPMETADYLATLIRDTAEFRALTQFTPPLPLAEAMRERIVAEQLTAEYVLTDELIEYLREQPERRERWRDLL